jgi:glycerol-1-phosphate dehydrogenase [NAD(P)+]
VSQALIDALIAGTLSDPDGGAPLQVATRSVVIEPSLEDAEGEVVKPLQLGRHFAVVSDPITHEILGARVEHALNGLGYVSRILLTGRPHPDEETVQRIRAAAASADALVAVGSGTINDLCKYAGAQDGKPYIVFPTAPSMNGYTSVNAAITIHGHKKSLTAQAPLGVFIDLSILSAAPARMIRSGLGDSLCRPTAQADWLLAHLLLNQPYRTMPFALLAEDEGQLFASSQALLEGDIEAMAALVRTLLLSGFGTAICGSSQPAIHGEQIGVTTLMMARLQERMLDGIPPVLHPSGADEEEFVRRYGESLGRSCWTEFVDKRLEGERLSRARERVADSWDAIRNTIASITKPWELLADVLRLAGAPTSHDDLGWPRAFSERAIRHARDIRSRYTFLDLAADSGRLEPIAALL